MHSIKKFHIEYKLDGVDISLLTIFNVHQRRLLDSWRFSSRYRSLVKEPAFPACFRMHPKWVIIRTVRPQRRFTAAVKRNDGASSRRRVMQRHAQARFPYERQPPSPLPRPVSHGIQLTPGDLCARSRDITLIGDFPRIRYGALFPERKHVRALPPRVASLWESNRQFQSRRVRDFFVSSRDAEMRNRP